MKRLTRSIYRYYVAFKNILAFLSVAIERGWPLNKWPVAWRYVQEQHQAALRRDLTELTMSGRVKRRIVNGKFIYSKMDNESKHGKNNKEFPPSLR